MKKHTIIKLILIMLVTFSRAEVNKSALETDLAKLDDFKVYYEKAQSKKATDLDYKNYYLNFPNSFSQFVNYFGYIVEDEEVFNEKDSDRNLYNSSTKYIEAFFINKNTDFDYRYNKIISISKDGKWEADAVSYFKSGIGEIIEAKDNTRANKLISILSKKNFKTQVSFWFFYFDGPHPVKKIPKEVIDLLSGNKKMLKALREGFGKLVYGH